MTLKGGSELLFPQHQEVRCFLRFGTVRKAIILLVMGTGTSGYF